MSINWDKVTSQAEKLHAKAAQIGAVKWKGISFTYDVRMRHWTAIFPDGSEINFNTRKLPEAKKWAQEYI